MVKGTVMTTHFTLSPSGFPKGSGAAPMSLSELVGEALVWELRAQEGGSVQTSGGRRSSGSKFRTRSRWSNPSGRGVPPQELGEESKTLGEGLELGVECQQ